MNTTVDAALREARARGLERLDALALPRDADAAADLLAEGAGAVMRRARKALDACRRHGKVLGMGGINGDVDAKRYIGMGARFLSSGSDHSYIVDGSIERAAFMRRLVAEAGEAGALVEDDGKGDAGAPGKDDRKGGGKGEGKAKKKKKRTKQRFLSMP